MKEVKTVMINQVLFNFFILNLCCTNCGSLNLAKHGGKFAILVFEVRIQFLISYVVLSFGP